MKIIKNIVHVDKFIFMKFFSIISILLINYNLAQGQQQIDSLKSKYSSAYTYLVHGNITGSEKIALSLLKTDSVNPNYIELMGYVCIAQKKYNDSKLYFRKSFSKGKNQLKYMGNIKIACALDAESDSELYYLNKLIYLKPDSARLYSERATFELLKNDDIGVRRDLKKAISLGDEHAKRLLKIYEDGDTSKGK